MEIELPLDFKEFLKLLNEKGVKYLKLPPCDQQGRPMRTFVTDFHGIVKKSAFQARKIR